MKKTTIDNVGTVSPKKRLLLGDAEYERQLLEFRSKIIRLMMQKANKYRKIFIENSVLLDEDIDQIVEIAIWKAFDAYSPEKGKETTFAGRVIQNDLYNIYNKIFTIKGKEGQVKNIETIEGQTEEESIDYWNNRINPSSKTSQIEKRIDFEILVDFIEKHVSKKSKSLLLARINDTPWPEGMTREQKKVEGAFYTFAKKELKTKLERILKNKYGAEINDIF